VARAIVDVAAAVVDAARNSASPIGGNRYLKGSNGSSFFTWFSLAGSDIAVDGTPVIRAGKVL